MGSARPMCRWSRTHRHRWRRRLRRRARRRGRRLLACPHAGCRAAYGSIGLLAAARSASRRRSSSAISSTSAGTKLSSTRRPSITRDTRPKSSPGRWSMRRSQGTRAAPRGVVVDERQYGPRSDEAYLHAWRRSPIPADPPGQELSDRGRGTLSAGCLPTPRITRPRYEGPAQRRFPPPDVRTTTAVEITDRQLLHGHVLPSRKPRGVGVAIEDGRIVDHGRVPVVILNGDERGTVRSRSSVIRLLLSGSARM